MKTTIIADDHPVTLNGMKIYIEKLGYKVLKACENGADSYNSILELKPDCAVLDLNMPEMNGLEVLEKVKQANTSTKIIIYTMYREKSLFNKAKALGADGYLLKDFALEELTTCLDNIKKGQSWFSPKLLDTLTIHKYDNETTKILSLTTSERKILKYIGADCNTKEISEILFISEKTVEKHRSNIIKKLGLPNERNVLQKFAIQNQQII